MGDKLTEYSERRYRGDAMSLSANGDFVAGRIHFLVIAHVFARAASRQSASIPPK